ncbi:MAG: AtpZ/AtpI family protein, partial [Polyangiaceae bacterium]
MPSPLYGRYAAVGFELTGSVLGGFFIGRAVDTRFDTHGIALWIGFFMGVSCGFWLLVRAARQLEKDAEADEKKEREEDDAAKILRRLEQVEREIGDGDRDSDS